MIVYLSEGKQGSGPKEGQISANVKAQVIGPFGATAQKDNFWTFIDLPF